jgi:hypothetical protein
MNKSGFKMRPNGMDVALASSAALSRELFLFAARGKFLVLHYFNMAMEHHYIVMILWSIVPLWSITIRSSLS